MTIIDIINIEWPSIFLACAIAFLSGPIFGITHDLYQILLSQWVKAFFDRLRGRS